MDKDEFRIMDEKSFVEYGTEEQRLELFNRIYTQSTALEAVSNCSKDMERVMRLGVYGDENDLYNNMCCLVATLTNAMSLYLTMSTALLKSRFTGGQSSPIIKKMENDCRNNPDLCRLLTKIADITGDGEVSAFVRRFAKEPEGKDGQDMTESEMLDAILKILRK